MLHEERAPRQWLNDLRNNAQVGTDRLQADRKPKSNTFENRLKETQHVCKDGFDAGRNKSSSYEIMFLPGQESPVNSALATSLRRHNTSSRKADAAKAWRRY